MIDIFLKKDLLNRKGDKPTKELVRISLKELDSIIKNPNILRIHRSYFVNKQKITSLKKTRKGYELIVSPLSDETLPVSSGYKDNFEDAMDINLSR